ncbi:MAG: site-specific integrase, partial [Lentisphaerae bacterium]|nr:site-specific integrase [Lentisphaerota bacterium]
MSRTTTGRTYKRGGRWWVDFTIDGHRTRRALNDADGKPVKTAEAARRELDRLTRPVTATAEVERLRLVSDALRHAETTADAAIEAARPRLALADAWTTYVGSMNRPQSGEATMRQYSLQWAAFVRWMAERRPEAPALADVTAEDAEAYLVDLAGRLAAGTVNKHRALLDLVFRVLGEREPLPAGSPFAKITPRRAVQAHREELRPETLWRVFEAANGELRRLLFVGLYSGQRLADCALLTWEQVDLRAGFITFRPQKTRRLDSVVSVPLVAHLRSELETTPEAERQGYVVPEVAAHYLANRDRVTDRVQALFRRCG